MRRLGRIIVTDRKIYRLEDTKMRICVTPGCGGEVVFAKGLCRPCYKDRLEEVKHEDKFETGPYYGMTITWNRLEAMGLCTQERKMTTRTPPKGKRRKKKR